MGLSSGASVLVARYFGARDSGRLSRTVHTAMLTALLLGVTLAAASVALVPSFLRLLKTPPEMMEDAAAYITIYFCGLPFLTVYNMGSASLTAVGNARYPLYFLLMSTVVNTLGDLLLIVNFRMGVAGAAFATIFAEALTAVLVCVVLARSKQDYRLRFRSLRIDAGLLRDIAKIGLPSALQGCIVSISNVVVMSYVNGLGSVAAAGYACASRLDGFMPLPVQAMALAVSTFVGQNLGAGKVKRARAGVRVAMVSGISVTLFLTMLALLFHSVLLRIFSPDPEVRDYGWQFMRVFAPGYFLLSGTQIIPGALRGAGDVKVSALASVGFFVVARQVYLFIMTKTVYTPFTVALGFPATWLLCALVIFLHYLRSDWHRFRLPDQDS